MANASEKYNRKDKNQNIQVFVRLRPQNQREKDIKSIGVVEVINNREVVVRQSQQTSLTKKFTFDKAFGPHAKQVEVYQDVVSPLIEEVLAGYNCTVFAYGQTGTGKTHTMVGEQTGDTNWQNDPLAGIIPRALSQLFDNLRIANTECNVRVSYLELYNEELFDLLSTSEDNSKLRIYEDVTRKGANIVNGLEEITVYNKNEVYKIMAQGQERKRVASTLMNAQSSRSHTVFTIVVHMKENSPEGEELVKIGKLNLVDLAGSENISKAGSDNPGKRERARECVNINQSLLTLGRVITALVERHPHIPYRESKLTRILQESLGGRTKTSIIATIAPGHKDLEETMSTLEYAHRAKNIQNKPEVNQKMTKKAILKEFSEEIDKLKRDLQAARDKNGVYLANETFADMTFKQEEQKKEIQELLLQKRAIEEERDKMTSVFAELNEQLSAKEMALNETSQRLQETRGALDTTSRMLKSERQHALEQRHIVEKQRQTEQALSSQARKLKEEAEAAAAHAHSLHDAFERRRCIEAANLRLTASFRELAARKRADAAAAACAFAAATTKGVGELCEKGETHSRDSIEHQEKNRGQIEELIQKIAAAMTEIRAQTELITEDLQSTALTKRDDLHKCMKKRTVELERLLQEACRRAREGAAGRQAGRGCGNVKAFLEQWYKECSTRVTSLRAAQTSFTSKWQSAAALHEEAKKRRLVVKQESNERRQQAFDDCLKKIEQEHEILERRLSKQLTDIENERSETEDRLLKWVEEERRVFEEQRRVFEERLQRHLAEQREIADVRAERRRAEIEEERSMLAERSDSVIAMHREQSQRIEREEQLERETEQEERAEGAEQGERLKAYHEDIDRGSTAISAELDALQSGLQRLLDGLREDVERAVEEDRVAVEGDAQRLVDADAQISQAFANEMDEALKQAVAASEAAMQRFVQDAQANSATTIASLNRMSSEAAALAQSELEHFTSQSAGLGLIAKRSDELSDTLLADVRELAELEAKFLVKEFAVYTPTGSTPARQEYRFPRSFAATSPHERLLANFRAQRLACDSDDCVVVESDNECTGDSESSLSEDSAVFAAPSPPVEKATANGRLPVPIAKCTSETDIYNIKKQQGKENIERSNSSVNSSTKKPSRLPAPHSHKKPLLDRNTAS